MSAESLDRNMIEASVTNAKPLVIRLQDKGNSDLFQMLTEPAEGNVYRIDKLANRMGFNRQLAAAVSFVKPRIPEQISQYMVDKRRPSPELVKAVTAMDENIDQMMLSGKNNGAPSRKLSSTAAICSQAVAWRLPGESVCDDSNESEQQQIRDESRLALERYGALEGLNSSQRLAVLGAASNRLTLVQGPPGTGKTAVAIRVIQHWAKLAMACTPFGENPAPILATSDSNIAVDNLVEGCANVGLRVVRLGRPEAIRPELLQYCIDRPTEDRAGGGRSNGSFSGGGAYGGGMSASMYKEKMRILKRAQVVCCTCIGSGGDMLDGMTFERVLVDEATQATEPAVLVPLVRGCRQLVLVGDHCQLPPTVLSTRAEEEGLGVPLFSRMVACGVPPFMLDTQYRMHPGISMFPSDLFYGGKLNDGVTPPERRPLAGFPWPREEFPVAFIPITDSAEIDDGVSKSNEAEASEVCHAVALLLSGGQCTVSDIAVVTPYSAQVRLIRRKLKDVLPKGPPFVEVSSTDGFQGREKEAVIFSAVRSNSYGAVGFVSDWRRINVSFTRARRALIVIGNPDTLCRGDPDTMGAWVQWADAMGVNISNPGKSRGRYDPEVLRKVRAGTTAAEMLKDVLECQQAQLKSAEKRQARAEKNAAGHIMGNENEGRESTSVDPQALKDDLAMLENADGCWDDSDSDDDHGMKHGSPLDHGSSTNTSNDEEAVDEPLDAWDL
jgi:regulator of nonsense transcripts 1